MRTHTSEETSGLAILLNKQAADKWPNNGELQCVPEIYRVHKRGMRARSTQSYSTTLNSGTCQAAHSTSYSSHQCEAGYQTIKKPASGQYGTKQSMESTG